MDRRSRRGDAPSPTTAHAQKLAVGCAQLTLPDVEFLGEQTGRTAGRAVAIEPTDGRQIVSLLMIGKSHPEATKQEGAFSLAQRPLIETKSINEAVPGEAVAHCLEGGNAARIGRRYRPTDGRHQQCSIDPRVIRRPLPPPGWMQAVRIGVGDQHVGQTLPLGALPRRRHFADASQSRRACQPRMSPTPLVHFPDSGVRLAPPVFYCLYQRLRGPPMHAVEAIEPRRGRKQQQGFAEPVELELVGHPIAGLDLGPGITGEIEVHLMRDDVAGNAIGGLEVRTVGKDALTDETHRVVEQRIAPAATTAWPA